jgi:hypothetical protein
MITEILRKSIQIFFFSLQQPAAMFLRTTDNIKQLNPFRFICMQIRKYIFLKKLKPVFSAYFKHSVYWFLGS